MNSFSLLSEQSQLPEDVHIVPVMESEEDSTILPIEEEATILPIEEESTILPIEEDSTILPIDDNNDDNNGISTYIIVLVAIFAFVIFPWCIYKLSQSLTNN